MKQFNPKTKTFKVFKAMYDGNSVTPAMARNRWGVGNLSAEASRIRAAGYAVYRTSRVAGNGVAVIEYELGRPSREIVALGYRARQLGISV